ncbi:MAG: putative ABC transporter permease [Lachnospiraceae bacterium]|nr:putative ABC transporter permease [Lachnospiraceae bacterium]
MSQTFYDIIILFFAYSFLAWLAETSVAAIKSKDFRNRGFASGPFCFIYGFTGVLLTVFLQELREDAFFLFLGSAAVATAIEWFTGKALEGMNQKRWWDYSGKKWNFDGYICLQYSVLWGIAGFLAVKYGNGFLLALYHLLPAMVEKAVVWGLTAVGLLDLAGTLMSVYHIEEKLPRVIRWNRRLQKWTIRFAANLSGRIENRIKKAYPSIAREEADAGEKAGEKCSITQLFWLFLIGAFVGDAVETLFCRITVGVWMSRSSLVWGHFSVVWGLAIALVTALLYRSKDKQEFHIFWIGTLLGGAYEYICSVFTELVFGKVFWDYSGMPFNLGGRINLLYCFFWGIAAVVWMKILYPKAIALIHMILKKTGRVLTLLLAVFIAVDVCVSILALVRYDSRGNGEEAVYKWEQVMDQYFDDGKMQQIYPNAMN